MTFRCLIVEDQTILLELLVGLLQQRNAQVSVACAQSVSAAIAACTALPPDLLILDMALPDGEGFEVAHALQRLKPTAKVIVLSSFASTVVRPTELRSMVHAILDKNRGLESLLEEVDQLLPPPEPTTIPQAASTADATVLDIAFEQLTKRERDVMLQLGRGQSSKMIAETLQISLRTVETHRRNLCSKLKLSGAALVRIASLAAQQQSLPGDDTKEPEA